MHVCLLGISHRTAPIGLRERLDFSSRDLGSAVQALAARRTPAEVVLLSTCNRSEVYVACDDLARTRSDVIDFLSTYHNVPAEMFVPHLFEHVDADATRHVFRVAAGLDSAIVGEPEVLGQVKDAFAAAAGSHCVGPLLTRLFEMSFTVGKRVRTETALGQGAVSIGFAAVKLARAAFGHLTGRHVLMIGAGEIASTTALHLRGHGVASITVVSRTLAGAEQLATAVDGRARAWDGLQSALRDADIVVSVTGAPRPVLTRADVEGALSAGRTRPLLIIDLAVPRDVEPSTGTIENVSLFNVDDVQGLVHENESRRHAEIERAESIVSEETDRFAAWHRSRGTVSTLVALRQRFEDIRRVELHRLGVKLSGLSDDDRRRVDEVTRLIVEKLLIEPTEQLRSLPDEATQTAYAEAVSRLFRLRDDPADSEPQPAARTAGRRSS
jgi:glutamyl-tRNA reductase